MTGYLTTGAEGVGVGVGVGVAGDPFVYAFKRFGPPQYSVLLPAHVMVQPDVAGTPPFWKVLSQSAVTAYN